MPHPQLMAAWQDTTPTLLTSVTSEEGGREVMCVCESVCVCVCVCVCVWFIKQSFIMYVNSCLKCYGQSIISYNSIVHRNVCEIKTGGKHNIVQQCMCVYSLLTL